MDLLELQHVTLVDVLSAFVDRQDLLHGLQDGHGAHGRERLAESDRRRFRIDRGAVEVGAYGTVLLFSRDEFPRAVLAVAYKLVIQRRAGPVELAVRELAKVLLRQFLA